MPIDARPGIALELARRRTVSALRGLLHRGDAIAFELDRPIGVGGPPGAPTSPWAGPVHPFLAKGFGYRLDERSLRKLADAPRIKARVTLSPEEQERQRSIRAVMGRLRTPPRAYDRFPYNAAPLASAAPGTAIARPLPGMR